MSTCVNRKRDDPPGEDSSDPESDAASEGGIDIRPDSGGPAEDESEPDDPEDPADGPIPTVPDCGNPWNSPEGFPALMEQMQKFYAQINDHGRVCSICGERKHTTRMVPMSRIREWHMDSKSARELREMMYPQYPEERIVREVSTAVCPISGIHIQADKYWVCDRCEREGRNRVKKARKDSAMEQRFSRDPMKYSKANTGLEFRWIGDDPLMELTYVEESMIATVNAVVTIQRLETREGMLNCMI